MIQTVKTIRLLRGYSFLLEQTVLRELRVRYKQTAFGILWAIVQPLTFTLIVYFVLGRFRGDSMGPATFANILIAMAAWTFFANSLMFSTTSISGHPNLVAKAAFPREVFPLSFLAVGLVDLSVNGVLIGAYCLIFHVPIDWGHVPNLLSGLIILLLTTSSLAILLAGLNVFYRDFKYVVPIVVQVLFFMTPVFYTLDLVPSNMQNLIKLNPLTFIMQSLQSPVTFSPAPLWASLIFSLVVLEASLRIFSGLNEKMADVV